MIPTPRKNYPGGTGACVSAACARRGGGRTEGIMIIPPSFSRPTRIIGSAFCGNSLFHFVYVRSGKFFLRRG